MLKIVNPLPPAHAAFSTSPRITPVSWQGRPAGSENGSQPSVVVPTPSFTRTMSPEIPSSGGGGPNAAPLAWYSPAAGDGGSTVALFGRVALRGTEPTRWGSAGSLTSKMWSPSKPDPTSLPSHVAVGLAGEFQDRTRRLRHTRTSPWSPAHCR